VKGNEDRRGPVIGHAAVLHEMKEAIDGAVASTSNIELNLAAALHWLARTGVTGYYASERDLAAQALLDARDEARKLTVHIDRALAEIRSIP
jgi:hypothetical protein